MSKSPIRKEERLTIDANTGRPAQSELGILVAVVTGNCLHEHHDRRRPGFPSAYGSPDTLDRRDPGHSVSSIDRAGGGFEKGPRIVASVAVCAILAGTLWLFRNEIGLMRQTQPPPSPPPDQSKPPAPNTTASCLSVLSAIYGDNCPFNPDDKGQVDVTSLMAEFCKKEPPGLCRYPIQQRVLGDPSKGCAKSFRVRYACGGEKDAIIKEAFVAPEAAGNYAAGARKEREDAAGISTYLTIRISDVFVGPRSHARDTDFLKAEAARSR